MLFSLLSALCSQLLIPTCFASPFSSICFSGLHSFCSLATLVPETEGGKKEREKKERENRVTGATMGLSTTGHFGLPISPSERRLIHVHLSCNSSFAFLISSSAESWVMIGVRGTARGSAVEDGGGGSACARKTAVRVLLHLSHLSCSCSVMSI